MRLSRAMTRRLEVPIVLSLERRIDLCYFLQLGDSGGDATLTLQGKLEALAMAKKREARRLVESAVRLQGERTGRL